MLKYYLIIIVLFGCGTEQPIKPTCTDHNGDGYNEVSQYSKEEQEIWDKSHKEARKKNWRKTKDYIINGPKYAYV